MKTLNTIQTLSKIGKVLSKIIYICCIVGFCGCVAGIIAMLIGGQAVKITGVTLNSILQTEAGTGQGTIWAAIAVGMLLCLGEFFVSRMAYRYFTNELTAGTPFTLNGAKELMHLGISTIWIPIVSIILAQVAQDIIVNLSGNAEVIALDDPSDNIILGITFIITSLLCRYGAELIQNNNTKENIVN